MLPVTRRKVIHIPHSLALVTAVAALIIAIGWTAGSSDPALSSAAGPENGATPTHAVVKKVDMAMTPADSESSEDASRTGPQPKASGPHGGPGRDRLPELLPPFVSFFPGY